MKKTGAKIILEFLEKMGVRFVTGIPGGSNLPLYDELGRSSIHHVLARHEQGAGFIAQGMARSTGQPGVVFVTSGPGATNLITALADAELDSVPVFAISGQVVQNLRGTNAFQEVETASIARNVVKFEAEVQNARELPDILIKAWKIALEGRPGPVLLDIPRNVFLEEIDTSDSVDFSISPHGKEKIDEQEWSEFLRLFKDSARPLILAGGGMRNLTDHGSFVEFINRSEIPVATTLMGTGSIPTTHPAHAGMVGMHGSSLSTALLDRADLLIALGTKFGDRSTGKTDGFAPGAKLVHVDIDQNEHGRILPAHLALHTSLDRFLQKLNDSPEDFQISHSWKTEILSLRRLIPGDPPGIEDEKRPTGFLRKISQMIPAKARVTTDVGQHQMWAARSMLFQFPGQFLTSAGLGTMGFGLPSAIGASLVDRKNPVFVISGDGSFLMNIQEMDTAVQEFSNIKVILLDNRQLGMVIQQQKLFLQGRLVSSRFETAPDFCGIARSFGWHAFSYESSQGDDSLHDFVNASGPALLHVMVSQEELVSPTVPPGLANRDAIHMDFHKEPILANI